MTVKQKLAMTAAGLVALAHVGHAGTMMNKAYVGVQGGLQYANMKSTNNSDEDTSNTADGADDYSFRSKKRKTSIALGALVGREMFRLRPDMPVCGEVSLGYNTSPSKEKVVVSNKDGNDTQNQSLRVRQTWKLGLSALIGKEITPDLTAALKLGVVYSNFNTFLGLAQTDGGAQYVNAPRKGKNLRLFGFEPGVRLSYKVNPCMSAHLETTYAMYQSKKKTVLDDTDESHRADTRIAPRIWGVMLGLTYKLGR